MWRLRVPTCGLGLHAGSCSPHPAGKAAGPLLLLSLFLCCSDRWSQEDMLTLLECMKNNLPSNDGSKFKTTESHLDWEKVAFKDFSGEMCKMKWMEISNEVTDSHMGIKGVCSRGTKCSGDLPGLFESLQLRALSPQPFTPTPSCCCWHCEPLGGAGTGRLRGSIIKPYGFVAC